MHEDQKSNSPTMTGHPDKRVRSDMLVNGGALTMALNVLRRANKNEVARELEITAMPLADHPSVAPGKPRVLVVVSGGVAHPVQDDDVDVAVFDWDKYKADPSNTLAVPAHFADLAKTCGVPVAIIHQRTESPITEGALRNDPAHQGPEAVQFTSVDEAKAAVEAGLAYLRANGDEPVSIRYTEKIDMEVFPLSQGDDRVLVGSEGWGYTGVNYTAEGLILQVYCGDPAILEPISDQYFYPDDLMDNEITGALDSSTAKPVSASVQRDGRG